VHRSRVASRTRILCTDITPSRVTQSWIKLDGLVRMASPSLSCQDSSLSVASSVIGILTFGYAVVAGFLTYLYLAGAFTSTTLQLYKSASGVLQENKETTTIIHHQGIVSGKLREDARSSDNSARLEILDAFDSAATELHGALKRVSLRDDHNRNIKWQSMKSSFENIQSKRDILELERRFSRSQEALLLHMIVSIKYA
jgi:hypothetical protein